ncbi:MFS sugar transporter, partial [Stenotrophomonas maltophilia]
MPPEPAQIRGNPHAQQALTQGSFANGNNQLVNVGQITTNSADQQVSLPTAGLLVSLYSLGVANGAPVLTPLTRRVPR